MFIECTGQSLKKVIIDEVRQRIIDGRYSLGQRLSENQLAGEFATSRAPVRDALVVLRSEGLVQVYPQRGSFVFNPTNEEQYQLCELCAIYETGALKIATSRNYTLLCSLLEKNIAEIEHAYEENSMSAWTMADRIFHTTFINLSENVFLIDAYHSIDTKITALVHRLPATKERIKYSLEHHKIIVSMISRSHFDMAARMLMENVYAVATLLEQGFDGRIYETCSFMREEYILS